MKELDSFCEASFPDEAFNQQSQHGISPCVQTFLQLNLRTRGYPLPLIEPHILNETRKALSKAKQMAQSPGTTKPTPRITKRQHLVDYLEGELKPHHVVMCTSQLTLAVGVEGRCSAASTTQVRVGLQRLPHPSPCPARSVV